MKRQTAALCVGLVLGLTAVMAAQESPLGSPRRIATRYGANYEEMVREALPKADLAMLNQVMEKVRAEAAAEKPLAITDPRQLEKAFGLRERGEADASGYFEVGEAAYRVDPDGQRLYLARRYGDVRRVPRKEFAGELAAIKTAHQELAERLGIPRSEVMFSDTREILSETDGHPELEKGVKGEIMAEGAVTTMLREVGGVLVEGSFVRVSSLDAKRLDLLDVRWPRLRLSKEALRAGIRSPQEVLPNITRRVAADSQGQPVNVRMAVVLRPVQAARAVEFVLSLKVGVAPQSIKTENGYRTDAGEVFFVDLVKGAPAFADPAARDSAEPKPGRPPGSSAN